MFSVTIIDDNLFESVEEFNLELRFDLRGGVTGVTPPSGVLLSPNVSKVRIDLDNGGNITDCDCCDDNIL